MEQMSRGHAAEGRHRAGAADQPGADALDEPTTGLDPRSKLDVQTFVEGLRDEHDATIVLTTHDLDEADRLAIGSRS